MRMSGSHEIAALAAAGGGIRVTTEHHALAECLRADLRCFGSARAPAPGVAGAVVRVGTDDDVSPCPGETSVAVAAALPLSERDRFNVLYRVAQGMAAALLGSGVVIMHGGLAETAGRRVLLAGASGAGKTTASRRLPGPWRSLSDDASQVLVGEGGGAAEGHGVAAAPWPTLSRIATGTCRERWACDDVGPLAAVFFLRHAAADELRRLGGAEATGNIYQSAQQFYAVRRTGVPPKPWMVAPADLFTAARRIARAVPIYELGHARRGRFWELIEQVLDEGEAGA